MIKAENAPAWLRFLGVNFYGWWLNRRRFNSDFKKYRSFLEESQYWSTKELETFQIERLYFLLNDVAKNVPFYGRHFASCGFSPSQFSNLNDLLCIEPVSKAHLRSAGQQCFHREFNKFRPKLCYSSGTTGEKFAYYVPEKIRFAFKYATIWRQYSWAGVNFLDRRITIGSRNFASKPPYWVKNISENQLLLSIHHLNRKNVETYFEQMKKFRPVFLQGHPSGVAYLAQQLVHREDKLPLKAVFTTGEVMLPEQREKIESAFECNVFEEYGLGECVFAAQESYEQRGFHEVSELGLIEFDTKDNGGLRQVIGTSLWNRAMPFIRYRVEDLVEPVLDSSECQEKLGLPVKIKQVIGRMDERLTNSEGQNVFPVSVRSCVKPLLKEGENYQVAQIGSKDYQLRLDSRNSKKTGKRFKEELMKVLGENAKIEIIFVDAIRSNGGKMRNVVNEYSPEEIS